MADADFVSVLDPFDYVCKQSDAKSEGKLRKTYEINVVKEDVKKVMKRFNQHGLQQLKEDQLEGRREELRQLVQRYIDRLREEVPNKFDPRTPSSQPLQEFQKRIDKTIRRTEHARFSLATTKKNNKGDRDDVCFVALVNKKLKESGDIAEMTFYFLQDGVKVSNTGDGEVQGGEEEGAVGGAVGGVAEEQRHGATLVLPIEWQGSFANSLESNIHLCHGHIRPALEALRTGRNSYTDLEGKICKFNSSGGNRQLVQGLKKFRSKLSYKLDGKNPHSKSCLCKVHLNGDGSDCYLVYVEQKYMREGQCRKVFLLVGVFTHSECGIKTGARRNEHATQMGNTLDIRDDMLAVEEFLQIPDTH